MLDEAMLQGHNIRFRLVQPDDAAYIHGLRISPDYGRHLSEPAPSVEAQQAWIIRYKARESAGEEYYFVIERCDDGTPCGIVRIYDILHDKFTWGSWILDERKPDKAALDTALLIYRIGFEMLSCTHSVFDVRADNKRTLSFHRRFGAVETYFDAQNVYFEIHKDDFSRLAPELDAVFVTN